MLPYFPYVDGLALSSTRFGGLYGFVFMWRSSSPSRYLRLVSVTTLVFAVTGTISVSRGIVRVSSVSRSP